MKNQTQERKNSSANGPRQEIVQARAVGRRAAAFRIPNDWKEVACIDFTGYTDRDCDERIIYKTPEGKLKSSVAAPGVVRIEDVTREKVTHWIHQCIIPEEFEEDFVIGSELFDAKTALEGQIYESTALTEAFAVLVSACEKAEHPLMTDGAPDSLISLAMTKGEELKGAFELLNNRKKVQTQGVIRRETLDFIQANASPEQLRWLDSKIDPIFQGLLRETHGC